jgi:hypothetical protein
MNECDDPLSNKADTTRGSCLNNSKLTAAKSNGVGVVCFEADFISTVAD